MSQQLSDSGSSQQPERAAADLPASPATAVAHLISSTNRLIASAHEHGRKAVRLRDHLIARFQFACARGLARLAWRFAAAGKRRVS